MRTTRTIALLLMFCSIALCGCSKSLAPALEEVGSVVGAEQSHIFVENQPIPYIARAYEKRSDAEMATDFAAVIAESEDLVPRPKAEKPPVPFYVLISPEFLEVEFGDSPPRSISIYTYYINADGTIRFAGKAGPSFDKHDTIQYSLFPKSAFEVRLRTKQTLDSAFGEMAGYVGVRMICQWSDSKIEYVFAYRMGTAA